MYAIIEVGAKQYSVKKDDIIEIEKQQVKEGSEVSLDRVLLVSSGSKVDIGQPYLKEAKVKALVLKQTRADKVTSYKYRRRKSSHWQKGHRQYLTRVQIKSIDLS